MTLRDWLAKEPFKLSLSAGFFGFYSHCGFMKALWDSKIYPSALSGSSAGALVSSLICAGMTPYQIEEALLPMRKTDFWDLKLGFGLLAGLKFESLLKRYLPEQFETLKYPLNVSTFDLSSRTTRTHQQGNLLLAVRASCCFPLLFHPVQINGKRHIDGGVADWLALKSLSHDDRVMIHMLEPQGFMSQTMKRKILGQVKSKSHKVVTLREHLPMGPNRMHLAQEAIDKSYHQTLRLLDEPFV